MEKRKFGKIGKALSGNRNGNVRERGALEKASGLGAERARNQTVSSKAVIFGRVRS